MTNAVVALVQLAMLAWLIADSSRNDALPDGGAGFVVAGGIVVMAHLILIAGFLWGERKWRWRRPGLVPATHLVGVLAMVWVCVLEGFT